MKIFQVNSSARSSGANSTRVADSISAKLQAKFPESVLTVRDLAANPHPVLDEATLGALFTPAEVRTPEQAARVALDDALIAQVKESDVLVLGVALYNFGITTQLKSFFDAIARAGVTFQYTANGPEGLLKGKKVYVALARGGVYRDTPNDTQVPYLKMILGFLGMTDVTFFYAEGLAMGEASAGKAFASVDAELQTVFA